MRRIVIVIAIVITALLAGACGAAKPRPVAPVKLSQLSPSDGTRVDATAIVVTGVVTPRRARVMVLGRQVTPAADGHFASTVQLRVGTNLIDVIAGSARARPAMTALRVVRYVLVTVPQVTGKTPKAASAAISAAGLRPKLEGNGDPFSFRVPFSQQICGQAPASGARVAPGTTVTLTVGKVCL